ncbi:MAG: YecA family protein [Burkholderiales bacterium]
MKIGRNDLCPCGSGKKYKKCCLGKEKHDIINMQYSAPVEERFPFLIEKVENIRNIIASYYFEDIVKAVFCICAWRDNRSATESCLALNQALTLHDMSGMERIQSYSDFETLYTKLKGLLDINTYDDITLNDFGEVKIKYDNNVYSVILGTGHENVFSLLQFVSNLAEITGKERVFKSVLGYSSDMIEYLKKYNVSKYPEYDKHFDMPSEIFFKKVCEFINTYPIPEKESEIVKILGDEERPIDIKHFICRDKVYPLFNPSIVVDTYCTILEHLSNEQNINHVNTVIQNTISQNYDLFRSETNINAIYSCAICSDEIKSLYPYTFGFPTDRAFIIALNREKYSDTELEEEVQKLRKLHVCNKLTIEEVSNSTSKNKRIITKIPNENNLEIIAYDSYTNTSKVNLVLLEKGRDYLYFSALDLVFVLNFIEDLDEFGEYIEFKRKQNYSITIQGGESNLFQLWKQQQKMIAKGAIEPNYLMVDYGGSDIYVYNEYNNLLNEYPFYLNDYLFNYPFSWVLHEKENGFLGYSSKSNKSVVGFGRKFGDNGYLFLSHNFKLYQRDQIDQQNYEILALINELNGRLFNRYIKLFDGIQSLNGKLIQYNYVPQQYAKQNLSYIFNNANTKYVYTVTCPLFSHIQNVRNHMKSSVHIHWASYYSMTYAV